MSTPSDDSIPHSQAKYEHAAVTEYMCPWCQGPLVEQVCHGNPGEGWLNCPPCSETEGAIVDWRANPETGALAVQMTARDAENPEVGDA